MRGELQAATAWEVEAARRQEVVASDFRTDRRWRDDEPSHEATGTAPMSRMAGLKSAINRTINHPAADPATDATPCPPGAVRAIKPGA